MGKVNRKDKGILRKLEVLIDGIPVRILSTKKPQGHFVYVHMKATDGEIFYVGQGVNSRFKGSSRGDWWKKIARKHGVEIGVVADNLTKAEAHKLEVDLIAHFGRRDLGLGPLVNHTDGGDGGVRMIVKDETKKRISEINTGLGNANADLTEYTFIHIKTNEEMTCTKFDFKMRVGASCAQLFTKNPQKTRRGWYLKGALSELQILEILEENRGTSNPNADKNVYTFVQTVTGEVFKGTRTEFQNKYNQNVGHLFSSNPSKTVKKWKVLPE